MKTKTQITSLLALALLSVLSFPISTHAQGTAFTYQGRLNDAAGPANGSYDLTFSIFGNSSGGGTVAGPLTNSATVVNNGLFTVPLDFGADVFNGNVRWLEITVRSNGVASSTTLSPRQPLTPAPYAIYAASAGTGGGSPWLLNGTSTYYNGGNVGIGSSTPSRRLEINTPVVGDGVNLLGNSPAYYLSDAGNIHRATFGHAQTAGFFSGDALPGDSVLRTDTGRLILQNGIFSSGLALNNNNVGIGTATPRSKLDVRGDIQCGSAGQYLATAGEENLRIIRGIIGPTGNIVAGSGFHVVKLFGNTQTIRITFDVSFTSTPSVTAMGTYNNSSDKDPWVINNNFGGATASSVTLDTTASKDCHFIAIGPR